MARNAAVQSGMTESPSVQIARSIDRPLLPVADRETRDRQLRRVCTHEMHVLPAVALDSSSGAREHARRVVHADQRPRRAESPPRLRKVQTGSARHVENGHSLGDPEPTDRFTTVAPEGEPAQRVVKGREAVVPTPDPDERVAIAGRSHGLERAGKVSNASRVTGQTRRGRRPGPQPAASLAQRNPTCMSPVSGVECPRAETRNPWHTFGSQRNEPPRITFSLFASGV